jgi:sodium transport system ATP-binding protein
VERLCDQVVVVAQGQTVAVGSVQALMAQAGSSDFEDTFVRLAFPPAGPGDHAKVAGTSAAANAAGAPA